MKTYEQMTQSIIKKVQVHKAEQRKRRTAIASSVACVCFLALLGALIGKTADVYSGDVTLANPTVSSKNPFQDAIVTPRVTLLCASSENNAFQVMEEKVKLPYKAELRVRSIAGMTETEKTELGKEEAAYISKMWGDYANESGFGRYMLDNVMVTTISVGEFGLKLDELDKVNRVRITVSENGMLISYPRVENGKTSAYTFEDGQQLQIDIAGDSLKACLAEKDRDTLGLFWQVSPWAVTKLDDDPDMDLSLLSDKITIWIDYTDGREEITTVNMKIDSDGKIYAVLEGTDIKT